MHSLLIMQEKFWSKINFVYSVTLLKSVVDKNQQAFQISNFWSNKSSIIVRNRNRFWIWNISGSWLEVYLQGCPPACSLLLAWPIRYIYCVSLFFNLWLAHLFEDSMVWSRTFEFRFFSYAFIPCCLLYDIVHVLFVKDLVVVFNHLNEGLVEDAMRAQVSLLDLCAKDVRSDCYGHVVGCHFILRFIPNEYFKEFGKKLQDVSVKHW